GMIHGGDFGVQDVRISLVEIDALLDHDLSFSRLSSRYDVGRSNSILAPIEYFKSGGACPFLAGIRQPSALREEFSLPIATWWLSSERSFSNYVGLSSRRNFLVTVQGRVSAWSLVVISSYSMSGLVLSR